MSRIHVYKNPAIVFHKSILKEIETRFSIENIEDLIARVQMKCKVFQRIIEEKNYPYT